MAIPLGVLAAVYLNEYGRQNRLAKVIRFMADVMTGVPVDRDGPVRRDDLGERRAPLRLLGLRGLARARARSMLPIVIRSSEEMLKLVPDDLRQASDALGARRWRTVVSVVLPGRAARAS